MRHLFHVQNRKSIGRKALRLSLIVAGIGAGGAGIAQADRTPSAAQYYGRWTVADEQPVFSARGREYKTVDIAPCSNDFCGVSVSDAGKCGARLFRFRTTRPAGEERLDGHGKWGDTRKTVQLSVYDSDENGGKTRLLYLVLGDGHDFGERAGNMPKFDANYRRLGSARCLSR